MKIQRKVAAGGLGGAVALVLITVVESSFKITVDGALGSAITVITTFLIGYFLPEADTATPVGSAELPQ